MRVERVLILSLVAIGSAAPAQEPAPDLLVRGRIMLPDERPLEGFGLDGAAPHYLPDPSFSAEAPLSGGLAFRLEYALSDRWGIAGSFDWQRTQAETVPREADAGAAHTDSVLATGQISFEF